MWPSGNVSPVFPNLIFQENLKMGDFNMKSHFYMLEFRSIKRPTKLHLWGRRGTRRPCEYSRVGQTRHQAPRVSIPRLVGTFCFVFVEEMERHFPGYLTGKVQADSSVCCLMGPCSLLLSPVGFDDILITRLPQVPMS